MGQLGGGGVDSLAQDGPAAEGDKKKNKKWGVGEMEFEAMMRMMDNAVSLTPFLLCTYSIPYLPYFVENMDGYKVRAIFFLFSLRHCEKVTKVLTFI